MSGELRGILVSTVPFVFLIAWFGYCLIVARAAAHEREACARVLEEWLLVMSNAKTGYESVIGSGCMRQIIEDIRARGSRR